MVLGCAFLWIMHPPGTLGPEGPHKPLLCTWSTGEIGEKLLKLRWIFPSFPVPQPSSQKGSTPHFWVHLSLSTCCDTQVAPRALCSEFRGFCLFWPSGKSFWGWFGTWSPLAKSWISKPSAVSWCPSMLLWGSWWCHTGQPHGLKTWLSPPRALVVFPKQHLLPFWGFLGISQEKRSKGSQEEHPEAAYPNK